MRAEYTKAAKARFYSRVTGLYLLTLLFAIYIFRPGLILKRPALALQDPSTQLTQPLAPVQPIITGTPVRVVIPSLNIDLPVDVGNYNNVDQSWTLADDRAFFASPSMPPNNRQGNTLVYGHDTDRIFHPTRNLVKGDLVKLLTDNGRTFFYSFESSETVQPDNMNVFQYQGPPLLVLQTCNGNWSETRNLMRFKFVRVE